MARQERPVDRGAGPLQAFAYDLRKVRVEAGAPTYRALARTAGYSPTTLSEAANGLRKPTLDVVLAYVGACGGDVEEWRRRWHDLDAALAADAATLVDDGVDSPAGDGSAAAWTGDGGEAEPSPAGAGSGAPSAPRQEPTVGVDDQAAGRAGPRWRRPLAYGLAGLVAAAAATGGVVALRDDDGATEPTLAGGCPPGPHRAAAFTAETYGSGVYVRRGPGRDHPVLYKIPPGCAIGLAGYCVGEELMDGTAGTPDVRWYRLADGGVLTSALVHGLPPAGLAPGSCNEGLPPPAEIRLTVEREPAARDRIRLAATGVRVDIVGFAAHHPVDPAMPDTRRWHQIRLADADARGATVSWRPDAAMGRRDPVPVVAVACLGGQGPTDVLDARMVHHDGRSTPTVLDVEQLAAAGRSACGYPRAD